MSDTKRGEKGPGFDYWSREANGEGKNLQQPGRFSKKTMNKAARHRNKQALRRQDLDQFESDDYEEE